MTQNKNNFTIQMREEDGEHRYFFYDNSKFIGSCLIDEDYLDTIEVNKKYRGQGYGRQILEYCINTLGVNSLNVKKDNEVAVKLYESLGFKVDEEFNYNDETIYYMTLDESINYNSIIDSAINGINKELDKLGFELEYIDDYDFEDADTEDWIGVFCQELQDSSDVFPVSINIKLLNEAVKNNEIDKEDLGYHIKKTLWHEAGHGIFRYCYDLIDALNIDSDIFDFDEERVVEEFAEYEMGENTYSKLLDIYDEVSNLNESSMFNKNKEEITEYLESKSLDEELSNEVDSEGNSLTKEQVEFFKDSKIRDRQGKLLVVYHGTMAEFDTFSKGDVGFHFGTHAQAFSIVDWNENAHIHKCYLNIKNPIYFGSDLYDWNYNTLKEVIIGDLKEIDDDYVYVIGHQFSVEDLKKYNISKDDLNTLESINDNDSMRKFLLSKNIDGIKYYNDGEDSSEGRDSYIAFEPNQIKSINNKKPTNNDSVNEELRQDLSDKPYEFDSEKDFFGNKLTKDQANYFKDSVVRIMGKLLPVYHGSDVSLNKFDRGYSNRHNKDNQGLHWCAFDKEYADDYGGNVYCGYLNIKHIVDIGNIDNYYNYDMAIEELSEATKISLEEIKEQMKNFDYIYQLTGTKWFMNKLIERGYDGVIAWESGLKTFGFIDSNQFKLMSNKQPTNSDNINEDLSQEQEEYFKDSVVRDDNGNLLVCYHGTSNPGFKEFNPKDNKSQFGDYKFNDYNVNYFTTNRRAAASYTEMGYESDGNVYACYINIENPFVVDNKSISDIKSSFNIKDDRLRDKQVKLFDTIFNKWKNKIVYYTDEEFKELNRDLAKLNLSLVSADIYENDVEDEDVEYFDLVTLGNNSMLGASHTIEYQYTTDELFSDDMYEQLREEIIGEDVDDYYLTTDDVVRYVIAMNEDGENFDGIIIDDILDSKDAFVGNGTDVITLKSSNQIKLIDNTNPTSSNRIDEDSKANIIDEIEKAFKTSDEPMLGPSFILPNGKFLIIPTPEQMKAGGLFSYKCHSLIYAWLVSRKLVKGSIWDINDMHYLEDKGCIRVNLGDIPDEDALLNYIQLGTKKPNYDQYDAILKWLDFAEHNNIKTIELQAVKWGKIKSYSFEDYTSDDIISKIKRYYSSGILYESENLDNKNMEDKFYNWQAGMSNFEDVFDDNDIKHIKENVITINKPIYRVEPKNNTNDNLNIGDVVDYSRIRSFSKDIKGFYDVLYMWEDSFEDLVCFKTIGNVNIFDCEKEFGLNYNIDYSSDDFISTLNTQKEVFSFGKFKVINKSKIKSEYTDEYYTLYTIKQLDLMEEDLIINEVYPNKGESKEDFISRFMSATKDEYPDQKQRLAVAYSYWDRRNKKKVNEEAKKDAIIVYRVGEVDDSGDYGIFFTDSLNYFDYSMTGYDKKDAAKYRLNLKDFKVWNPIKELNLDVDTWSTIWGRVEDFEEYEIYYEYSDDAEEDEEYAFTSTDDLALAGKELGYDIIILEDIPGDQGYGPEFTEYAVNNLNAITSLNDDKSLDEAGYNGYSMSNNAVDAYESGQKPLSKWTKEYILNSIEEVDSSKVDMFRKLNLDELKNFLTYSSWHHTSYYYNKTDFYELDVDKVSNTTIEDINNIINNRTKKQVKQLSNTKKGKINYIEWSGTRNHPKANQRELDNVNIEEKGSYYIVTDDEGKQLLKKMIGSNGTRVKYYESTSFINEQVNSSKTYYHGSSQKFDKFNQPINWFSDSLSYAEDYATYVNSKNIGYIYTCNLNCKNTFDCGDTDFKVFGPMFIVREDDYTSQFKSLKDNLRLTDEEVKELINNVCKEQHDNSQEYKYRLKIHIVTRTKAFRDLVMSKGYDSIRTLEEDSECIGVFNGDDVTVKSIDEMSIIH